MTLFRRSLIAFVFALSGAAALEWADDARALDRIGLTRQDLATRHDVNLGDCLLGRTDPSWPAAYRAICADLVRGGGGPPQIISESPVLDAPDKLAAVKTDDKSALDLRDKAPIPVAKIQPPKEKIKPVVVAKPVDVTLAVAPAKEMIAPQAQKPVCFINERGATTLQKQGSPRVLPPLLAHLKANGVPQPGVALVVETFCTVASPVDGKVMYAGDFKGYRGVVIIRLKSGQQLIVAGLDRIDVKRTSHVTRGTALGATSSELAPALASAYGKTPDTTLLYFDLRNAKGMGEKLSWLPQAG
ncbi:MAG: M23 family metallopeptidase [Pseudomonadota bacterium]